ncbi:MAG: hypothetical protein U0836_09545 [Pirellulales bacterium]
MALSLPHESGHQPAAASDMPAEKTADLRRASSLAMARKLLARKSLRTAARLAAGLSAASEERN